MDISHLGNFPISSRFLNEILYDYLSAEVKPVFCMNIDENTADISCLKCCKVIRNSEHTPKGSQRPWRKRVLRIELTNTPEFKERVKKMTYFEYEVKEKGKIKIKTAYCDFHMLSSVEQFTLANVIIEQHSSVIPEYFRKCITGEC